MVKFKLTFVMLVFLALASFSAAKMAPLKLGFYWKNRSCPQAEDIVKQVVSQFVKNDSSLAASLLRMHFHDCFVRGCDASVLLNSSTSGGPAEKVAPPNLSLRGFEVIDAIKSSLEAACPQTVSCADILALAARDAVSEIFGPFWKVPTGRRDGVASVALETLTNLPPPTANFTTLKSIFASKGLNVIDLVILSGGHTIGFSHCSSIDARLYNFTGKGDTDPALDPAYAAQLKLKCKKGDQVTKIPMDSSVVTFDTSYYQFIKQKKGLFESDAALLATRRSRSLVDVSLQSPIFLPQFARAMTKMGRVGILTGTQGQIRKNCALVN